MKTNNEMQVVHLNNHHFAVEERNGNMSFNLTQMAKPFGTSKKPANWLRSQPAQEYIEALSKAHIRDLADSVSHKITLADLVEVRKGGTPELAGTWTTDYRIAMRFAQWLDPKFSIMVDELIFKVLTRQVAIATAPDKYGVKAMLWDGRAIYPYTEILRSLEASTRGSSSRRRNKFPNHFVKLFGRNFITAEFADILHGYYKWKNAQLKLNFGAPIKSIGGDKW